MSGARTLSALKPGERGRVVAIGGEGATAQRLMDLGLVRGTTVEVVRAAPLGDPLEVRVRGFMLTLRRAEAAHITIDG